MKLFHSFTLIHRFRFVLLSADEWDKLVKFVDVDTAVVIRKSIVNGGVSLESDPGMWPTAFLHFHFSLTASNSNCLEIANFKHLRVGKDRNLNN